MCLNSVGDWLGDFGSLKDHVKKVGLERRYQSLVMCLAMSSVGVVWVVLDSWRVCRESWVYAG